MKEEKFNGKHVAMIALAAFVTLLFVGGIQTLNNQSGEKEETAQAVQIAEREKAAFINKYHPRWFDVDLHGAESYVTYRVDVKRGGYFHTLMCEGIAGIHLGHWYVHPYGKCTRVDSRRIRLKRKKDDPMAWITSPFYDPA